MPETGDLETGTHDRENNPHDAHPGWGEAFAALPQDSPDAGGWQRVQARLPAPASPSRVRWPLWLATAASLVLAVAIPLRMLPRVESAGSASAPQAVSVPAPTRFAPAAIVPKPATTVISNIVAQVPPASVASRDKQRPAAHVAPSQRPFRTAETTVNETPIATAEVQPPTDLRPLYAQSAQLESLLALARDDRVARGTSAALSDALDTELANIDARLIQPGLDDTRRADLWRQRVDALQQLVGIETTNRLYAARGQTYDAALVSID